MIDDHGHDHDANIDKHNVDSKDKIKIILIWRMPTLSWFIIPHFKSS